MILSHDKKPNRAEAFAIVAALKRGEQPDPAAIDSLINYFAPTLPKTAKTSAQWVAKAVRVDGDGPLRYVHARGGVMYATDQHRMHYAPTELADGAYDPKTMLPVAADVAGTAPNFTAVLPDMTRMTPAAVSDFTINLADRSIDGGNKYNRTRRLGDAVAVCEYYFLDAINGFNDTTIYYTDGRTPIAGAHELGAFVIMGIRI